MSAILRIDNHTLEGEAEADASGFEVVLVHTDGDGPAHGDRVRLNAELAGDELRGTFDDGTTRGEWIGRKQ